MALATLALGLALLLLPGLHAVPEISTVLFAVALAMLAVTLVLSRTERRGTPPAASTPILEMPRRTAQALSSPAPARTPAAPVAVRTASPGRGSAWRILSFPTEPGNETWLSWLPRESRRLGPDTSSVGSGVITSPGRAGNLVAFPVRDYFGGALPPAARGVMASLPPRTGGRGAEGDEHLPALSVSRAAPFSEDELDRMFPPQERRGSVFLAAAPDRIGVHSRWSISAPVEDLSMEISGESSDVPGRGEDREASEDISVMPHRWVGPQSATSPAPADVVDHEQPSRPPAGRTDASSTELSREAVNPIPPHLRGSGTLIRTRPLPTARGGRGHSPPRSVCASCSKVVVDLRLSGPCPRCLRPLCHDCLREALATVGHGWCPDCSRAPVAA